MDIFFLCQYYTFIDQVHVWNDVLPKGTSLPDYLPCYFRKSSIVSNNIIDETERSRVVTWLFDILWHQMKTDVTLGILYCLNKRSQSQLLWIHHWKLKIRCSARLCYGNRDSISRWKQSESLFSKQLIICFSVTVCVCVNIFRFYTTSKHCREACILLCLSHSRTLSLCLSLTHARMHTHTKQVKSINIF